MAIKMRVNTNSDTVCCECGEGANEVLNMFDVCVADNTFTICDSCNEKLFMKTLKAECYKNGRVKSPHDMSIIHRRNSKIRYFGEGD